VILESQPGMLTSPAALDRLDIPTNSGASVPLGTVATFTPGNASLLVSRVAQFPAATIGLTWPACRSPAVDAVIATEARLACPKGSAPVLGASAFRRR
jgi:multidrug efflux pump